MKSPYLVCYDISDDRRLQRVFNYMKARGIHLQYSVFYCELTWQDLQNLKNDLSALIDPGRDDVRIYPLQKDSLIAVLGCGDRIPEGVELILGT
ncbi:MAG: CRISPR-associated endonuclease Cas2 [Thermodesulfovibrionales bacterium]|nr:CRISPR-associated endonuclease Cas2 [Thermodesulfovibrionales bacterium]